MLAAVVLHTLVTEGRGGMTSIQMTAACERNPANPGDTQEIQVGLRVLLEDGLAERAGDLYKPTRAAVRAAELSF